MTLPHLRQAVVCLAFLALTTVASYGQMKAKHNVPFSQESLSFRAGLRNAPNQRGLDAEQRQQVLQGLREKTGWASLTFDEAGFLVCPNPQDFTSGSASARELLKAAFAGDVRYELESHSRSHTVRFAQLTHGSDLFSHITGEHISIQAIQLDFDDYQQLFGDRQARAAFDIGLGVLHELAHGVWHLRDEGNTATEPGDCENFINRIRRELNLPERQTYEARSHPNHLNHTPGRQYIAELHFVSSAPNKPKRYLLRWMADAVGAIRFVKIRKGRTLPVSE